MSEDQDQKPKQEKKYRGPGGKLFTLKEIEAMKEKISGKLKAAWTNRDNNRLGTRVNGTTSPEVQKRISKSVLQSWKQGDYKNRVNGMLGKTGGTNSKTDLRRYYKNLYDNIFSDLYCEICGTEDRKLDIHHLDENRGNYLLSNLVRLCVPCHLHEYHYHKHSFLSPFVSISKDFHFEYAHILPWHTGKCGFLHGHSGLLTVSIEGRINPNGVVKDFFDISQIVKRTVIDVLDHKFLNDFLPNPTSEELLIHIWWELERGGLKGLTELKFKETDSSECKVSKKQILDSFEWTCDENWNNWLLVMKTRED